MKETILFPMLERKAQFGRGTKNKLPRGSAYDRMAQLEWTATMTPIMAEMQDIIALRKGILMGRNKV